jgi:hypothetical protein
MFLVVGMADNYPQEKSGAVWMHGLVISDSGEQSLFNLRGRTLFSTESIISTAAGSAFSNSSSLQ